jgi:hypothetical protein
MYRYLAAFDRNWFLPGVGLIPPDSVTLLNTNPRFIEAFMVGLNYEMSRELLWRGYPTDQRGTVFRHFWDRIGNAPDIDRIDQWDKDPTKGVGVHMTGGSASERVLLVRGELFRRFPNTVIYAVKSVGGKLSTNVTDVKLPVLSGALDPDVVFVGFDLDESDLDWFFVLQQQPTEPRFGFHDSPPAIAGSPPAWSDVTWDNTQTRPGTHLVIARNPLVGMTRTNVTFVSNAAALAAITLQKPMLVAIHARQLVKQDGQ